MLEILYFSLQTSISLRQLSLIFHLLKISHSFPISSSNPNIHAHTNTNTHTHTHTRTIPDFKKINTKSPEADKVVSCLYKRKFIKVVKTALGILIKIW